MNNDNIIYRAMAVAIALVFLIIVIINVGTVFKDSPYTIESALKFLYNNNYTAYADPSSNLNTHNVLPITDSTYNIGSSSDRYANGYFDNLTTSNLSIIGGSFVAPTGRNSTFIIAASDAPTVWKNQSDVTATSGNLNTLLIAAFANGYTDILLSPGTFSNIVLTQANAGDGWTISGCGYYTNITTNGADVDVVKITDADSWTIENLRVTGDKVNAPNKDGITFWGVCDDVTERNIWVEDTGDDGLDTGNTNNPSNRGLFQNIRIKDAGGTGISANKNDYSVFDNIIIWDSDGDGSNTQWGFSPDGLHNTTVSNMIFYGLNKYALHLYDNADAIVRSCEEMTFNNIIIDGTGYNAGETAVYIEDACKNITFNGLTINGSQGRAMVIQDDVTDIHFNNLVITGAGNGVYLNQVNNITFNDGSVIDTIGEAFYINSSNRTVIQGIDIYDSRSGGSRTQTYGIREIESDYNTFVNNNIYNNSTTDLSINGTNTSKLSKETEIIYYLNVTATSGNNVHSVIAGDGTLQTITTSINNPDFPRDIRVATTNVATPSGTMTITGTDQFDRIISEDVTLNAGGNVDTNHAFKTVTSFTIPSTVSVADNVSLGAARKFGLPAPILTTGDAVYCEQNGSAYAPTYNANYHTANIGSVNTNDDFLFVINTPKDNILAP